MRPTANWVLAGTLTLAVLSSGCMAPPSSPTAASPLGTTASEPPASYTPPSTTHPPPLKNAHVDQAQSEALTNYLKAHHLPLVGAQVLSAPGGERQVILFGFVATDYGKGDAESKARRYINDPAASLDNRIKIEPTLAKPNTTRGSQTADADSMSGIEAYENQSYEDQLQQQQQMYGYQNQGPSPMSTMIPLLGMFGASFGGGSFGVSSGVVGPAFGGGYPVTPPPPSYGYPSYPYP